MSNDQSFYKYEDENYPLDDNTKDYRRIKGLQPDQFIEDEMRDFQFMPARQDRYAPYSGNHSYTQPRSSNPYEIHYQAPSDGRDNAQSKKYTIDNNAKPRHRDPRALMMIILIGLGVIVTGIVVILVVPKSSGNDITAVQQPASASQVAAKLDCTAFKSADTGASGMVVSAGTCTKVGVKYVVDTFVSQNVRDNWLKAAEPLGVNPKWETATSVVYGSVTGGK
jgi:hypothetical protein